MSLDRSAFDAACSISCSRIVVAFSVLSLCDLCDLCGYSLLSSFASSAKLRELRVLCHPYTRPQRVFAIAVTDCGVGTVWSSSTGENGTGTSIAPMRLTGASR